MSTVSVKLYIMSILLATGHRSVRGVSTVSVKLYIMSILLATGHRSVRVCVYSVCKTLHYVDISYWSQICKGVCLQCL